MNNDVKKIKYVSLFFRILFLVLFVAIITKQIFGWMVAPLHTWTGVIPGVYLAYLPQVLDTNTRLAGFLVTLAPTGIKLMLLYFLIKLFRLYEQHEFFSSNNVYYIRNVGYALLLEQIVRPLSDFVLGFVLTSGNPPELRYAGMFITDSNLGLLLMAMLIILVSWIMSEGHKLYDEQQLTI